MKISVSTKEPITVIDKSRKPWEMNGNKGVVYKAICHKKVGDEAQVEDVRITEEVYNEIEPMHRYHFDATIDVKNSRMEVTRAFPVSDGNPVKDNPAPDGNPVKDNPAPDGNAGKDNPAPDGNPVKDNPAPDGNAGKDNPAPGKHPAPPK